MMMPSGQSLRFALGVAALLAALCMSVPPAKAQFFWPPWFEDRPRAPKPHVPSAKPAPPAGDDLPPVEPKESLAPPPPDDRPYDDKLLRLAEILGAVHYLRELCGAQEGQLWRDQMQEIVKDEGTTAVRRAKLVSSFNDGYRGYRRTYRTCTPSATLAVSRFTGEGAQIAEALAKSSQAASHAPAPAPASADKQAPATAKTSSDDAAHDKSGQGKPGQPAVVKPQSKAQAQDTTAPQPDSTHQGRKHTQKQLQAPNDAPAGGW